MKQALIVDDSRQMADSLAQMLDFLGIISKPAYGSRGALVALKEFVPDIVFLDLNMPGVTGFDVLMFIKREPRLEKVPVIVVSSDDQPESIERANQAGASGYIVKPPTLDTLEEALKSINFIE
jgi:two-component system chemotaxis response regulator CheY